MEATRFAVLVQVSDTVSDDDLAIVLRDHAERLDAIAKAVSERTRKAWNDDTFTSKGAAEVARQLATAAVEAIGSVTDTVVEPLERELSRIQPSAFALLHAGTAPSAAERESYVEIRDDLRRQLEAEDLPDAWLRRRALEAVEADERDILGALLSWPGPKETWGITSELLATVHEALFRARRPDDRARRDQLTNALELIRSNGLRAVAAVEQAAGVAVVEPAAKIV